MSACRSRWSSRAPVSTSPASISTNRRTHGSTRARATFPTCPITSWRSVVNSGKLRATADVGCLGAHGCHRHLCADAASKDEGSGSVLRRSRPSRQWRRRSGRVSSSSSSRRPIPGRPTRSCSRCSRPGGLKAERDFFLAFSPERVDPGNGRSSPRTSRRSWAESAPPAPRRRACSTASVVSTVVPVSSTRVAEMVKLLENTFRAVNIGLVNEIALMCRRMDIDVWEVIEAAKTKPFGFMPFYPGPGLGGHCIPIDPFYLSWKARQIGLRVPVHRARGTNQCIDAALRGRARR